jgi:hypothetical protein
MSATPDRHAETPLERAARDPIGLQHDWLHAHEANTGQETLEGAIDIATGTDPATTAEAGAREAQERDRIIRTQFG